MKRLRHMKFQHEKFIRARISLPAARSRVIRELHDHAERTTPLAERRVSYGLSAVRRPHRRRYLPPSKSRTAAVMAETPVLIEGSRSGA